MRLFRVPVRILLVSTFMATQGDTIASDTHTRFDDPVSVHDDQSLQSALAMGPTLSSDDYTSTGLVLAQQSSSAEDDAPVPLREVRLRFSTFTKIEGGPT